jgi:hypothetical protein
MLLNWMLTGFLSVFILPIKQRAEPQVWGSALCFIGRLLAEQLGGSTSASIEGRSLEIRLELPGVYADCNPASYEN